MVMEGNRYKCTKYTKKGIHLQLVGENVGGGSGGGGGGAEGGNDAHGNDAHGKDEGKGLICTPADLPLQDVDICFCSMAAEKNNADETPVEDANSEKTPASVEKAVTSVEEDDSDDDPDYKPAKTPEKTSKKKRTEKTPEKTKKKRRKKKLGEVQSTSPKRK